MGGEEEKKVKRRTRNGRYGGATSLEARVAALELKIAEQSVVSLNLTHEKHGHACDDTWKPQLMYTSLLGESHGIRSGPVDELPLGDDRLS